MDYMDIYKQCDIMAGVSAAEAKAYSSDHEAESVIRTAAKRVEAVSDMVRNWTETMSAHVMDGQAMRAAQASRDLQRQATELAAEAVSLAAAARLLYASQNSRALTEVLDDWAALKAEREEDWL